MQPPPGSATEQDLINSDSSDGLCELVDGMLVEKPMGSFESRLVAVLIHLIETYLDANRIGVVYGEAAPFRLFAGLVRLTDVAYLSRHRLPGGHVPRDAVNPNIPDFVVEILSQGNTTAEMKRKIGEYFRAGVRLVWLVDPVRRVVASYTAPDQCRELSETEELPLLDLLPGFRLTLATWLSRTE